MIILALIGYVADKNGYFDKNINDELETVDFSELSKPKEEETTKKEEDISSNFDELPDVGTEIKDEYSELPTEEMEDLYAPFGDQEIQTNDTSVVDEVEEDLYNQSFVDVERIEAEAIDINQEEEKKKVEDLMRGEFDMEFEMPEDEKKEKIESIEEQSEQKSEDDGITDMWKF